MEHMSNIFSTSFGINFAKLTLVWLALISLTAKINSLLFLSHPVYWLPKLQRTELKDDHCTNDYRKHHKLLINYCVARVAATLARGRQALSINRVNNNNQ